jgi:hypothetical protein
LIETSHDCKTRAGSYDSYDGTVADSGGDRQVSLCGAAIEAVFQLEPLRGFTPLTLSKVALVLVVIVVVPAWAEAGPVAAITPAGTVTVNSVGGPGGGSTGNSASGSTAFVDLVYTSVNFIDVVLSVSASGSYELYEGGAGIAVTNNTNSVWTSFTFSLLTTAPPGTQFTGADPDATGNFRTATVTSNLVTYSGGTVPGGVVPAIPAIPALAPAVDFIAGGAGLVTIRETPGIGVPVPEPSGLVQGGIAAVLAGVGLARRGLRPRARVLADCGRA